VAARNFSDAFVFADEKLLFQWTWQDTGSCDIRRRTLGAIDCFLRNKTVAFLGDCHMWRFYNHIAWRLGRPGTPNMGAKNHWTTLPRGGRLTYSSALYADDLNRQLRQR
jgi:hypothetical protein